MTLEDIARLCEVSRSTVSRVINRDPNVSDRTRKKVLEVIQLYNFQPNIAARGLAAGHTGVIGLVIPMGVSAIFTDPFFPLLIQGVSAACNENDYSVMLWLAEPEYERRTIRQILYNGLVDGVIVSSMRVNDPIVEALAESKQPFLTIGRQPDGKAISYVDVTNRTGSYTITRHLLKLGRRRIATITGPSNMVGVMDRLDGYLTALKDAGITPDPNLIVEGNFTDISGYQAMQGLLPYQPDAVFAASDIMALAAMRAVCETGLRVPQDIAVVGFDDITLAERSTPPLTTVRQDILHVGAVGAETLIDMIHHPEGTPRRIVLPTELIVRATCGSLLT